MSRKNKGVGKEATQFKDKGVGVAGVVPIPTRYPLEVDEILRALPNKSAYIRDAVIKQLRADGLIR